VGARVQPSATPVADADEAAPATATAEPEAEVDALPDETAEDELNCVPDAVPVAAADPDAELVLNCEPVAVAVAVPAASPTPASPRAVESETSTESEIVRWYSTRTRHESLAVTTSAAPVATSRVV
jgi:hypothetical protein